MAFTFHTYCPNLALLTGIRGQGGACREFPEFSSLGGFGGQGGKIGNFRNSPP